MYTILYTATRREARGSELFAAPIARTLRVGPVTTSMIVNHLLGITTDPTDLDVNGDGQIDVGDVIQSVNSAP
ncbi:hypothetical protein ACFL34_03085 [Candidatus Sumerlaeota bacterium]